MGTTSVKRTQVLLGAAKIIIIIGLSFYLLMRGVTDITQVHAQYGLTENGQVIKIKYTKLLDPTMDFYKQKSILEFFSYWKNEGRIEGTIHDMDLENPKSPGSVFGKVEDIDGFEIYLFNNVKIKVFDDPSLDSEIVWEDRSY